MSLQRIPTPANCHGCVPTRHFLQVKVKATPITNSFIFCSFKMNSTAAINKIYNYMLGEKARVNIDRATLGFSIAGFFIHLILIVLVNLKYIKIGNAHSFFINPIAAIYTPFSFILFYEVYLLIFYLPKSISKYIGKQYEIITLIIIRRAFKDLSELELTADFFTKKNDIYFMYDLLTVLILFALIIIFYALSRRKDDAQAVKEENKEISRFIKIKIIIASLLMPVFVALSIYSFSMWLIEVTAVTNISANTTADINKIFFDQFFTILILSDVLLLLLSFVHTDKFNVVMRNSGFVLSTILIKLSFGTTGLVSNLLIVTALVFGISILFLHNKFNLLENTIVLLPSEPTKA